MEWMTLLTQTDCSWTEWWQCSQNQTVHGLTNTAATSDFMDWMTFPKHILSITHKIWDLRFSNSTAKDSGLLWCEAMWLGEWFLVYQSITVPSQHQEPCTQPHSVTSQNTWTLTSYKLSCTSFPRKLESTTFSSIIFCFCWVPYSLTSCILITCYRPSSTETTTC